MRLNSKSISIISFVIIFAVVALMFGLGTNGFKNWDTNTWFGKGSQTELNDYTVTAEVYKNLQKFSYWEDENGNKVSSENPYTYKSTAEKKLTAVYEDFVEMVGDSWISSNKEYNTMSLGEADGWFSMAYLTEPLKYGISIEFTLSSQTQQFIFGLSDYERVTNSQNYGWCPGGYENLFIPNFNIYSGVEVGRERLGYLQQMTDMSQISTIGKVYFDNCSCVVPLELPENYKIRIELGDQILIYFNDELLTADNLPETVNIDKEKDYYFSFAANTSVMSITDFGYIN